MLVICNTTVRVKQGFDYVTRARTAAGAGSSGLVSYGHTEYFEFNSGCSSVQSESLGRSYTNLKIRMDIQLLN